MTGEELDSFDEPHPMTMNTSQKRGRPHSNRTSAASWIRSASTSNILKLQRNSPATEKHTTHSPIRNVFNSIPTVDGDVPALTIAKKPVLQSSMSESTIQSMVTNSQDNSDVVVDVLPSFEMYNALHRHIPQGNVDPDRHDFPPTYNEIQSQMHVIPNNNSSSSTSLSNNHSSENITFSPPSVPSSSNIINSLHPLTTQHLNLQSTRTVDEDSIPIQDDLDDNENIFIDKLYTLPKKATPVDIAIRITKHASLPPHKPDEESILKEYTTGDVIHGYCVIENKSPTPLKFEMFYVTLEAYTSLIDRQKGKRTVKRFLRMVDLSASWSYGNIDMGTGFRIVPGQRDFDNSVTGLSNNRILEPGVKYKKFFMFKFPKQLLDVTCKQEHFSHCLLPPSFGIDKYRNNCKYSSIKVNSVLGCGHLGSKGSPILTYDLVDDNLSINYTIDARVVGKDQMTKQLNIMKEKEYNIRYVPFGFDSSQIGERDPSRQLKDLVQLIQERLTALKLVFDRLDKDEPIKNEDIHGTDLSGTVDSNSELNSDEILRNKLNQLHLNNRSSRDYSQAPQYADKKAMQPEEDIIDAELSYKMKNKHKTNGKGLFSGFRSSSSSTSLASGHLDTTNSNADKFGLILVQTKVPHKSLKYLSPSLLKKTNNFESKTKPAQENWCQLSQTIPENEYDAIQNLQLSLTCIQSNNSLPHEPPEIQAISTELITVTGKSESSIPVKLDAKLLMDDDKLESIRKTFHQYLDQIVTYNTKFMDNYEKLNVLYNANRTQGEDRELKFTDFISGQIYSDVESLSNLKAQVQHLGDIFKKQLETLKTEEELESINDVGGDVIPPKKRSSIKIVNAKGGLATSASISRNSISTRFTNQIVHQWNQKSPLQWERSVNINLEFNKNVLETLVPSFESCLCCRFYCVRVNIKFHHIGSTYIDIPINVRNF